MMTRISSKKYWEENIKGFSGFYDKGSEEKLHGPRLIKRVYKKVIFPIEERYMKQRFENVSDFIVKNVRPGMTIADIGCGSGIYTKQMASIGAKVFAIDFSKSALELTRNYLGPDELSRVEFLHCDVADQPTPRTDLSIAIGVMPYVEHLDSFLDNILPFTKSFYFNFLNADSWLNIIRRKFPVLDVRGYFYYSVNDIHRKLNEKDFHVVDMRKLATGFLVESIKK